MRLTGLQARSVAQGIAEYMRTSETGVWACAILPDHLHLVTSRSRHDIEQVVIQLKGSVTRRLESDRLHPMAAWRDPNGRLPKVFAQGSWNVYLNTPDDILRAIRYVERNPLKDGLPLPRWRFVQPYVEPRAAGERSRKDDPSSIWKAKTTGGAGGTHYNRDDW